jgi:hypothetical protein
VRESDSDAIRAATLTWWDETMSTRLNDPATGAKVIVMQRVHENDLVGLPLSRPAAPALWAGTRPHR